MPSCSSHSPQSDTPMSPMPIASVTLAPQPSSSFARKAGSPPPGSPATRTRSTDEPARSTLLGPLEEVRGVRRREHRGFGREPLDREQQPLGVAGADRDVAQADPVEGRERGARDERPGVVRRDDALSGLDAGSRVAARRPRHPVVEVARRERDVARRAGRAARRVDADDLVRVRAEMRAERVVLRRRSA